MLNTNPFQYTRAEDRYFVGREEELNEWRKRLAPGSEEWKRGQHWLILAPGGMGKSSLLEKIKTVSEKEFKAFVIHVDFGQHRLETSPENLLLDFKTQLAGAPDLGTRARKMVDLPMDASQAELMYQSVAELFKIAGLSGLLSSAVGVGPSLPTLKKEWPTDFALQIASIYDGIRETSKRGKRPLAVLIDQLDKAHDSELWVYVARLLLACMHKSLLDGQRQIVFVVAMRLEGFARLEAKLWQQHQDAFDKFFFLRQYLKPFSRQEASLAIQKRAPGQIPAGLEAGILREIGRGGEFDPYQVVEAASAVWTYLHRAEHQRSAAEVKPEDIRAIITDYYKEITKNFQRWNTQWQVLRLLTNRYPFGLSTAQIAKELTGSEISRDIEEAIAQLLSQPMYPILYEYKPSCYMIAHELLQKGLYENFPKEDQLIDEARKTYESAVWRYQYKQDFFSDIELKTTWEYRNQLAFEPIVWKAVASTLVRDWQPDRLDWLIHYPTEISAALQKAVSGKVEDESAERAYLMLACLQNTAEQHTQAAKMVLATIANKDPDEQARLTAVEGLAFLGETARDALTEIAGNSPFESVRLEAAEGLSGLGEAGRGELAFLTWNRPRDRSRRRAAGWLGFLGTDDPEAMIEIEAMLPEVDPGELVDMARNHPDELRRMKAAGWLAYLGKMGIARDVLVDLAWKSPHEGMRIDAADGLADLEETQIAREVLADLAHNSPDETMRLEAVEKLASLGETQMAREALAELAKKSSTEEVRIEAAEELARLGEEQIAREVLVELARNSPDEGLRWRAAEGLAGLGEKLYLLSCTLEDILFSERIFRLLHFVIYRSHLNTSGRYTRGLSNRSVLR